MGGFVGGLFSDSLSVVAALRRAFSSPARFRPESQKSGQTPNLARPPFPPTCGASRRPVLWSRVRSRTDQRLLALDFWFRLAEKSEIIRRQSVLTVITPPSSFAPLQSAVRSSGITPFTGPLIRDGARSAEPAARHWELAKFRGAPGSIRAEANNLLRDLAVYWSGAPGRYFFMR